MDLCVVKTPLETPYLTSVVETPGICHGCIFPNSYGPSHLQTRQVHVIHIDKPEGGIVDLVLKDEDASEVIEMESDGQVVVSLHSASSVPVKYSVSSDLALNTTDLLFIVSVFLVLFLAIKLDLANKSTHNVYISVLFRN